MELAFKDVAYQAWRQQQITIDELFKTMWIELENLLQTPDFVSLAENHLQASNYTVKGYYDLHDNYYKSIEIPQCTLMFRGVKISYKNIYHRLLQYSLYVDTTIIGELTLVYDKQGNFIDKQVLLFVNKI